MATPKPVAEPLSETKLLNFLREKVKEHLHEQGMSWGIKKWTHSNYQKLAAMVSHELSQSKLLSEAEKQQIGTTLSVSTLKRILKKITKSLMAEVLKH